MRLVQWAVVIAAIAIVVLAVRAAIHDPCAEAGGEWVAIAEETRIVEVNGTCLVRTDYGCSLYSKRDQERIYTLWECRGGDSEPIRQTSWRRA